MEDKLVGGLVDVVVAAGIAVVVEVVLLNRKCIKTYTLTYIKYSIRLFV